MFKVSVKTKRDEKRDERDHPQMPPTQIERGLRELTVVWIPAHSPQAKGRVERQFLTAQDRLVKGLRVAGASTIEEANAYLEKEYLPWWNQTLAVTAADPADAHRPLSKEHDLAAILSHVELRQVTNDYTVRYDARSIKSTAEMFRPECASLGCASRSAWTGPSRCSSRGAMCVQPSAGHLVLVTYVLPITFIYCWASVLMRYVYSPPESAAYRASVVRDRHRAVCRSRVGTRIAPRLRPLLSPLSHRTAPVCWS